MFGFKVCFTNNGSIDAITINVSCELFDGVGLGQHRDVQYIQRWHWFVVSTRQRRGSGGVCSCSMAERDNTQRTMASLLCAADHLMIVCKHRTMTADDRDFPGCRRTIE